MSSGLAVVLVALGGFFLGGAWSLRRQQRPWWAQAVVPAFGMLCVVGGVLNL